MTTATHNGYESKKVLYILGMNLRFPLVFAGAIGVGLGFQNMASNVIKGIIKGEHL